MKSSDPVPAEEKPERSVEAANLGEVGAARSALDVGLAVDQRDRAGIPARAVHVQAARQRVVAAVEQVAVVVAGVGGGGAGPVVSAGDEDVARQRQQQLRAAEDVGAGRVGKHLVSDVRRAGPIPQVVDEVAGLLAVGVGAVGQHAAVRHQHGMDGDQGPAVDRRPHAFQVRVARYRAAGKESGGALPTDGIRRLAACRRRRRRPPEVRRPGHDQACGGRVGMPCGRSAMSTVSRWRHGFDTPILPTQQK